MLSKITWIPIVIFCCVYLGYSQDRFLDKLPPDHIRTIQIRAIGEQYSGIPIIPLGSGITLTFDDLDGAESDYYYQIKHCNADWSRSVLSKNEYLQGFDEIRIVDYENSFNTLQLYSHYRLQIPNEDTKGFRVSGNYLIEIYDSNTNLVFSKKCIVYEKQITIKPQIRRVRNLKFIQTKQRIQFEITPIQQFLRNPRQTVQVHVFQNQDLKHSIRDLKPQFTVGNTLVYKYDLEASFEGGNEFLAFDSKSIRMATIDIQRIELKDLYHHYLFTDRSRSGQNYTFNPDINGNFVVRNLHTDDSDIQADYVWMHFSLKVEQEFTDREVHLYGNFNGYNLDSSTRLTYDPVQRSYQGKRLFKQGFYNYKYVVKNSDNSIGYGVVSGNFDETENRYTLVVYYRSPGGRYDKVIGTAEISGP